MPADLVSTAEALDILQRKAPSTVARLVRSGRLNPVTKLPGKRGAYLFEREAVERLAAEWASERAS